MLFALISCMGFNENTVWLIELSSEISGDCSSTLEHNFFVEYESDNGDYVSVEDSKSIRHDGEVGPLQARV